MKTHFILGLIGAPFGLDGFVKVKPFSGETDHFSRLKNVTLRQNEKEKIWEIAEIVIQKDKLLLRFEGIQSPEAAKFLQGAEIITEREYAAPLREGEFYVEELKDLEVTNREGEALGHISDMAEGGGGWLAEVMLNTGKKQFVPFRNEFFGEVDAKNGKIMLLEPWILDEK